MAPIPDVHAQKKGNRGSLDYIFIDNNKAIVALPTFLHCIKMPPHQGALQAQLQ